MLQSLSHFISNGSGGFNACTPVCWGVACRVNAHLTRLGLPLEGKPWTLGSCTLEAAVTHKQTNEVKQHQVCKHVHLRAHFV